MRRDPGLPAHDHARAVAAPEKPKGGESYEYDIRGGRRERRQKHGSAREPGREGRLPEVKLRNLAQSRLRSADPGAARTSPVALCRTASLP